MANLREQFEQRYGPLWSGATSLSIDGVTHELHDIMHRLGFGFEGLKIIDAPAVEAGRYAVRFYDGEERRIVCLEFGADLVIVEEHRVHVAEWLGASYFETEFQVNCPMDF